MNFRGLLLAAMALLGAACGTPGKPGLESEIIKPGRVADFNQLYAANCAGCHGPQGRGGVAIELNNPVYLAIANDEVIRRVTAEGVSGTSMPPFAQRSGGMLTEAQIDNIVAGIRARWSKPGMLSNVDPPPYSTQVSGDPSRGANVYATYCASCHGADGRGTARGSGIVDASYLSLVSDQSLRTIVIVGRPDLGAPDWRGNVRGKPMSHDEVSDVVAWLAAQRPSLTSESFSSALQTEGGVR